jgi:Rrf2 family iron-sulfur cluster assembly transcriptional regulator
VKKQGKTPVSGPAEEGTAVMRLSTKGRYAVMAMADLAGNAVQPDIAGGVRPVALADIAARQDIYRLSRPAGEVRIADIIMAVDEPIAATRCKTGSTKGCTKSGARCVTHDLWEELGQQIHVFLSSVSLADVVERRVLGRARPCNDVGFADGGNDVGFADGGNDVGFADGGNGMPAKDETVAAE